MLSNLICLKVIQFDNLNRFYVQVIYNPDIIFSWEAEILLYTKMSMSLWALFIKHKICSISFKYYFEPHLIYKWSYFRQTIFNQLNIMVSYVDISGLYHSVAILWEIYVMQRKCNLRRLRFHFKRMLITELGQ